MREEQLTNMRETAVRQSERTITNRIDTMGVLEPTVIARPNDGDIIIEVPGAQEASFERIKSIISRTAQLKFQIVDDESDSRARARIAAARSSRSRGSSFHTYRRASPSSSRTSNPVKNPHIRPSMVTAKPRA